ncbi:DUF6503 family protein [Gelidibacter mesophilus]|uniref:DUF6503 family protein n=1 Tax=Gelidibacter mesophilus TaxID=169050 RepID=UPI00041FAF91|nr:DUF6503 family protein [Gelidibacter mesophilus]
MFRKFFVLVVLVTFFNCKEKEQQTIDTASAEAIIQKSIEVAGGRLFDHSNISFDFRDIHYRALRDHGKFQLERHFKDSISEIRDVLSNSGFERYRNGEKVHLVDSIVSLYSASVNSVHYFAVLPYGLDGKAVHKEYLGTTEIKGNEYHKIKVTFSEDGGGEDYEDEFIYWISRGRLTVDYLAYSYKEIDGQGFRFREAFNVREVNGLRFADYNNYKPTTSNIDFVNIDALFIADKLQLLSRIELKNITVKALN